VPYKSTIDIDIDNKKLNFGRRDSARRPLHKPYNFLPKLDSLHGYIFVADSMGLAPVNLTRLRNGRIV